MTWPQLHYRHRNILHNTITGHQIAGNARLFNLFLFFFPIETKLLNDGVNKSFPSTLFGVNYCQQRSAGD